MKLGETEFDFQNILVIDFGQLGDVILSLPALKAIRERFPEAKISLLLGKPGADLVKFARVADEQILVDRVRLRDGNKLTSLAAIFALIKDIRGRRFDLIIDLNSLSETNILGFLSGARWRLYANRENRSLDWLGRFPTRPPKEDKSKHYTDRYFDALIPLGIESYDRKFRLNPPDTIAAEIDVLFDQLAIADKRRIGIFVGAGHPSRQWSLGKFAELSRRLVNNTGNAVLIFLGPEEIHMLDQIRNTFPPESIILDKLALLPLMAAATRLDLLVSNDTGPVHLAAVAGAPVILILDRRAPACFLPLAEKLCVLDDWTIDELSVDHVFDAIQRFGPREKG